MKKFFIVFCFLTSFIYSIQNETDEIIFKYRNEYLQYSYCNNEDFEGIKKDANLKRIYVNDTLENFPYDGVEIVVRKNGRINYVKTINELSKLEKKQIRNPINSQTQVETFLDEDFFDFRKYGIEAEKKKNNLKKEENQILKKIIYLELDLPKEEYRVLLQKIKVLETKAKTYYENKPYPLGKRVETQEYVVNLGYVTEIQILTQSIAYFDEEKELLKGNEIFLLSEEIKNYIENYVEKEYIENIN